MLISDQRRQVMDDERSCSTWKCCSARKAPSARNDSGQWTPRRCNRMYEVVVHGSVTHMSCGVVRLGALALFACSAAPQQAAPASPETPPSPPPAPIVVTVPAGIGMPAPYRNQPPGLKLKLGHYSNPDVGIGVTIDLSTRIDNVAKLAPAKLRFDGDARIWVLAGQHAPGRIDYVRDGGGVVRNAW